MLQRRRGTTDRSRRAVLGGLGFATIVVYGACYYAFGAFIGPISVSTGWPEGTLGVVFAGVLVLNGALAIVGGRIVDRQGPRTALVVAGTVGAGAMFVVVGPIEPGRFRRRLYRRVRARWCHGLLPRDPANSRAGCGSSRARHRAPHHLWRFSRARCTFP